MTKHISDETLPKMDLSLNLAEQLVAQNVRVLNTQPPRACNCPRAKPLHRVATRPSAIKPRPTRPKVDTIKNRLEKTMRKLYELEPESAPEKSIQLDLCVDLYQMENF